MTASPPMIWLNGRLISASDAKISPFDQGFLTGDGLFESLKSYAGVIFRPLQHYNRLASGAEFLGLSVPDFETIETAIQETISANDYEGSDARIRVTLSRGFEGQKTLIVTVGDPPIYPETGSVITVPYTRNERSPLVGIKSTSYGENVVALNQARKQGAFEAIFANTQGNLCEGTGSNIFLVLDGVLITPPLSSGCLPGVTRAAVLELCSKHGIECREIDTSIDDLSEAEEAFATSTYKEILPIIAVNSQPIPSGQKTTAMQKIFQQMCRTG